MSIVYIEDLKQKTIDIKTLQANNRKLSEGLIAPPETFERSELVKEHSAEPIKNLNDIFRISKYLISLGRYRDNMLFVTGINFGLRASDLLSLRFIDLIDENFVFRECFKVFEKKTRNTRKRKHNRYIGINTAVIEAVTLYLEHTEGVKLSDYMFVAESNNVVTATPQPLATQSVNRILKGIANDLGLGIRMSSHSLRKTFCYHQMVMSGNSPRKLLLLQKMLGHSTSAQTLDYIGITSEEIDEAYKQLNLGGSDCYLVRDTNIVEFDSAM